MAFDEDDDEIAGAQPTPEMRECVQRFVTLRELHHVCPNQCCCRCLVERYGPRLLAAWDEEQA